MKGSATSQRSNVATSPRRDVPMSRRWVNQYRSHQSETSRRLNVATFQRHDVSTSRRQHGICTSSFKEPMVQNGGHREAYERGHGIPEQQ